MAKKIVVVNAGPRKGWNTDTLISEAARGAQSAGAYRALGARGKSSRGSASAMTD